MTLRSFTALVLLLSFKGTVTEDSMCPMSKMMEFGASSHFTKCSLDSGTRKTPAMSDLSLEEIKVYCDSAACVRFMDEMRAAKLGDCLLPVGKVLLQTNVLDAFDTKCSAVRSMGSSSNATGTIRDGSSSSATSSAATIAVCWIAAITVIMLTLFN